MTSAEEFDALSPTGPARPTQSYLRELLEANGLRPRRQLGQNFLVDLNLLDLLLRAANLPPNAVVLEVGAGTGGMTTRLAAAAARVVTVEIDPGFQRLVQQEIRDLPNVKLIAGDALAGKNKMNPEVLAAVRDALAETNATEYHLVANLPYDVATSVVGNLLVDELPIRSLTITVQFEVGERMAAEPGSKNYGPMSALVQRIGRIEWVRTLPPTAFWPRPKVDSCILHIEVEEARRQPLDELRRWHRWVRDLFLHRRKTLRAALASVPGYKALKPEIDGVLASVDLTGDVRAENLSHDELWDLFRGLDELTAKSAAP